MCAFYVELHIGNRVAMIVDSAIYSKIKENLLRYEKDISSRT